MDSLAMAKHAYGFQRVSRLLGSDRSSGRLLLAAGLVAWAVENGEARVLGKLWVGLA